MAADTTCGHADVVKRGAQPTHRGMTDIAGLDRRNMGCTFTGSDDAIVARLTTAQHFSMIHRDYRCKDIRRVTGLANIRGTNMIGVFAKGCRAIMTG